MSAYDHTISALNGTPDLMSDIAGKTALFVNTASKCGLTPQYEQLQGLQDRFGDEDFTVVGFPCNQFLEQEPGTADEISEFCQVNYGVTFPLSEKIDVNGESQHSLFAELERSADVSDGHTGDVRWNFEKFLVNPSGDVVARFAPTVAPDDPAVIAAIEAELA
ncbi:MAG: glutathione peroxidase [Microthrixaceae bacterium]|nr:glutathione peroxidase [Microthrixaceae bacterium]MCO5311796.1 glutathione peroxidase [Microthrixaceae bacterium]HPB44308.1 glutathione peroxidase [Microthrixaceae bacterium]